MHVTKASTLHTSCPKVVVNQVHDTWLMAAGKAPLPSSPTLHVCRVQNPKNVQVKEELTRLRRRLKAAERELQEKRTQSEQRADKIKKLKDDLEQITAGVEPLIQFIMWVVMSPGAPCVK